MGAKKNAVMLNDTPEVADINLSATRRKRFRINGDNNKILELNTSDMNILARLKDVYPKLRSLAQSVGTISDEDLLPHETDEEEEASLKSLSEKWKAIDDEMREFVDYIFDSNVSEVCASDGSMYDPFNGKFRFEWIIDSLLDLYSESIHAEFAKMKQNVAKHTSKYIR